VVQFSASSRDPPETSHVSNDDLVPSVVSSAMHANALVAGGRAGANEYQLCHRS